MLFYKIDLVDGNITYLECKDARVNWGVPEGYRGPTKVLCGEAGGDYEAM